MVNEYNGDQDVLFDLLRFDIIHVAQDLEATTYVSLDTDKLTELQDIARELRSLEARLASVVEV